ncbi:MAG: ABC transporter ATP-binding protein [Candidatus Sedimenticola endophacoides]|uniref:Probable ATP-binding protein YheS n=1 Tax=Candidatus Sedimenticola endophacoides TaxID=2548426 RepID=A0A6N4E0M3_9GAMM|nr:MAG: ABC transporter ATP-binding protein [Candidatus Sedimenticola endophacoides]PUD99597.1 MAG: ABC transporter ATP-binding protein [Candidatus Sedimenticola endophacoides]PUE03218.1 MAG: ABC transporter ATP-binding protein [Candidatus Sedimenticola endophacoides]PUE04644.1 MAG: ABC transporter ATP-binding protein [Candidatus Sedimenticola endophacoides]
MLRFDRLSLRRGPQRLFADASLTIHPGQRVGVTGANGCGKSSLFALILDQLHADSGDFSRPREWVIAHVAQETPADTRSALEYTLDGDRELRDIEAALAEAEAAHQGERVAELHTRLDNVGGYSARARAARLIHGLGFRPGEESLPVNRFSGGWRMRLNLARALMCRSDLLLLDEPTNHLDLDAVIWLEQWLKGYPGTLLLISHDRDFLDSVTSHIAHIEQGTMTLYSGNYSAFEHIRAERLANQQAAFERQQREVAHIHSYVERFRAKATKARQAQSRLKALERMERIAPAHVDSPFHFRFRPPRKNPHPLLRLERATVGYDAPPILDGVTLALSPGDRIGLLGPNGAGKSTLIKLLAGGLPPGTGSRETAQDLNIGYFAQHQLDQLHPGHSAIEHLRQIDSAASEQSLRDYLGGFGFTGERADSPVAPFSGGEKARLVLALLVYQRPNLLLLDEPTNHLDLEMRHALSQALQEFEGAMVVVSHDRHLLRTTSDRLLLINGGAVDEFRGDLDDYPRWLAENRAEARAPQSDEGDKHHSAAAKRERKRLEAQRRGQLQPLRQAVERLDQKLERLGQRRLELEQALAAPELYEAASKERLKALLGDKAELDRALEQTETQWFDACEALETAQQALE